MADDLPLDGRRILVVEDDYYLASDEKTVLERAGAHVVGPFGTSEKALSAAEKGKIDCAVVDINLGMGPSFVVARALQERQIPFLFVTGYDEGIVPNELRHIRRLEKPSVDRELIAAIKASLLQGLSH